MHLCVVLLTNQVKCKYRLALGTHRLYGIQHMYTPVSCQQRRILRLISPPSRWYNYHVWAKSRQDLVQSLEASKLLMHWAWVWEADERGPVHARLMCSLHVPQLLLCFPRTILTSLIHFVASFTWIILCMSLHHSPSFYVLIYCPSRTFEPGGKKSSQHSCHDNPSSICTYNGTSGSDRDGQGTQHMLCQVFRCTNCFCLIVNSGLSWNSLALCYSKYIYSPFLSKPFFGCTVLRSPS